VDRRRIFDDAEGKRLGYFKHETAGDGLKAKTITSVALWQRSQGCERAEPV